MYRVSGIHTSVSVACAELQIFILRERTPACVLSARCFFALVDIVVPLHVAVAAHALIVFSCRSWPFLKGTL